MQRQNFTYFRQISAVLSTITMLFGFLLITVLLTVSVNQRLGDIAALRALGFSRRRVAADVLWQSVFLVGLGGLLALPLGIALSTWLDSILKAMPGIPASMHFFVFEPRALLLHAALLGLTALCAAVYPMQLVARLPIAATLRNEGGVVTTALIDAAELTKTFPMGAGPVHALRNLSLRIGPAEHVAIRGPSGCGKSTLLHVLGCVDMPTTGTLLIDGRSVQGLSDADRSALRLLSIGFVFQRFFLLPMLTAFENVEVPQAEAGVGRADRRRRSAELLDYVGLSHRTHHRPAQLSRRRSPTGGDRARACEPPAVAAGRRTDRRARSGHRRGDCGAARSRPTPMAQRWSSSPTTRRSRSALHGRS